MEICIWLYLTLETGPLNNHHAMQAPYCEDLHLRNCWLRFSFIDEITYLQYMIYGLQFKHENVFSMRCIIRIENESSISKLSTWKSNCFSERSILNEMKLKNNYNSIQKFRSNMRTSMSHFTSVIPEVNYLIEHFRKLTIKVILGLS